MPYGAKLMIWAAWVAVAAFVAQLACEVANLPFAWIALLVVARQLTVVPFVLGGIAIVRADPPSDMRFPCAYVGTITITATTVAASLWLLAVFGFGWQRQLVERGPVDIEPLASLYFIASAVRIVSWPLTLLFAVIAVQRNRQVRTVRVAAALLLPLAWIATVTVQIIPEWFLSAMRDPGTLTPADVQFISRWALAASPILVLGVGVWTFVWIGLAKGRWDRSDRCDFCGYSLVGLEPTMPCPECGIPTKDPWVAPYQRRRVRLEHVLNTSTKSELR